MYIYCITNLVNNKKYVGQTIKDNPNNRWKEHINVAKRNSPYHIHKAIIMYGVKNFQFEVIDGSASNIDELNDLEEFYIGFYDTFKGVGYNSTSGGDNFIHSEETKKKMSLRHAGEKNSFYGKKHSNETKQKISKAGVGRIVSDETRQKLSKSLKGLGIGIRRSNEIKYKISKSLIGNTRSSKKVVQIDKDNGEEITCWFSAVNAMEILKIDKSSISRCCKNKANYAGGFVWRYM